MINASKAFKNALAEGKILYEIVDITFSDGRKKTLDSEILVGGGTFTDCAESNSFPIGATVCKSMTLSLDNAEDQWKDYYFYKAKLTAYLKIQVTDSVVETIKKGTYTVTTPEQYGEVLEFTALDDMYKANASYTSNLVLPQPAFTLLRDACTTIGISMGFSSMEHGDVVINSIPDGITFRQLIGWVAMLDSANARVDVNGNLQLIKWDFDSVSVDYGATVGADGYLVFGGGSSADSDGFISPNVGNWYLDSNGYLTLKEGVGNPTRLRDYLSSPTLSSDDIVITGIKVKNTESDAMCGKDGYVLELENNLLSDADLGTVAGWIGDNLIGKSFRSMEGSLIYNPLTEFGDIAFTYDRKENKYITPITDVSSRLNGTTDVKTKAENPIRGSSKFLSSADKTLIAAKKIIENEKTAREQAVKKLENALANSEGLFETLEVLEDKSVITYLHDKPLLEESKVVIKLTSNAIGVSNDGGETYPYGFVVDGTLITRLLYAEGINADYIDSGALTVRNSDGNIIFQADMNTKKVYLDGSVQIGGGKTINNIEQTAENAMKAAALAKNMTLQLSNEYQGISVDSNGNYETFPNGVTTQAVVMYGTQDITADCSYAISKSDGVDGTWDISTKTYTVTGLNTDNGWIDIKATYLETLSVSKRFSVSKQYAGEKGEQGVPGRTYFIEMSADILKRGQDNKVSPNYITAKAYYRDGDKAERKEYKGRWKVQTSTDGSTYSDVLASIVDESTKSYTVGSLDRSVVYIRFILYEAGENNNQLDMQTIPILIDVDALTHEEIFNLLTNDGAIKGIYKEGNQLYISFTYAKGGTLKLGGENNGYGTLEVYDKDGNIICKINNKDGFKNIKGNEWAQIKESILSAGFGNITDGLLDLSAQYENKRNVVLQSITGDLILKVAQNFMIEGMKSLTGGNPMMFSPSYLYVGYSSSSSMRYKVLGKSIKEDELEDLYRIKVIWAKYKDGYLSEQDERYGKEMPMFIAEDIDRRFPIAVDHNEKGKAENWNYRIMIPCMFAMLKNEHEKVKELQSELESIKTELTELKEVINQYIVKKEV
nr:MAG TPA: Receptor recognition protein, Long tail, Helical sandwich, Tail fiber [Caudoviricetes sp.]